MAGGFADIAVRHFSVDDSLFEDGFHVFGTLFVAYILHFHVWIFLHVPGAYMGLLVGLYNPR